jgi:hypothetical protein
VAATDLGSVAVDLKSGRSYFERHLKDYRGVDPQKFAKEHQLQAQALLGGLVALTHCMLHFGVWVDAAPPPPRAMRPRNLDDLGQSVLQENGVVVWLTGSKAE